MRGVLDTWYALARECLSGVTLFQDGVIEGSPRVFDEGVEAGYILRVGFEHGPAFLRRR